jgi:hypothetical protein
MVIHEMLAIHSWDVHNISQFIDKKMQKLMKDFNIK